MSALTINMTLGAVVFGAGVMLVVVGLHIMFVGVVE